MSQTRIFCNICYLPLAYCKCGTNLSGDTKTYVSTGTYARCGGDCYHWQKEYNKLEDKIEKAIEILKDSENKAPTCRINKALKILEG